MEIEAKFRALERLRPRDLEAVDISPFLLGERETHELRDTLLDTGACAVRDSMHSLRLRYDNGVGYLTLKGPKIVQGATHIRAETEVPLGDGDPLDPDTWSAEIADEVRGLTGGEPLERLMSIRNRRRSWPVYLNGAVVAEVALDRGRIVAGKSVEKLHEVEIELKGSGGAAELDALVTRYSAALPLEAEPRSKAQRAWALWERIYRVDDVLERAASALPMAADAPLAEAARAVLARHLRKLRSALQVARQGEDPEGVHQARVATRRLRAVLAELGGIVYEPRRVQRLRRGLRGLARTLGAVRDADVFLAALDDESAPLYTLVAGRRTEDRASMSDLLDSKRHARLMDRLFNFVTTPGEGVVLNGEGVAGLSRVRDFAGSMTWARYEAVRAYDAALEGADFPTVHRLRIEVKRLRYLLELFGDLLENGKELREVCTAVQEHLGALNDTTVALVLLEQAAFDHEEPAALERERAAVLRRQHELYDATPSALASLMGVEYREALARAVARL